MFTKYKESIAAFTVVFIISILLSLLISRVLDAQSRLKFDTQSAAIKTSIENRTNLYVNQLYSLQAFFGSSDFVNRKEFEQFISKTNVFKNFPGINSLAFTQKVLASNKNSYIQTVKNDTSLDPKGYPDFKTTPVGDNSDTYYFVTYREPFSPNDPAFGFNSGSVAERLSAITNSINNNTITNSGKTIILGTNDIGFAIYAPVYKNGVPIETVDQRQKAAVGVVSAGFIPKILFSEISDENLPTDSGYIFQVFDGGINQDNLLYSSNGSNSLITNSTLSSDLIINIANKEWHLASYAPSGYGLVTGQIVAPAFAVIIGIVLGSAAALIIYLYRNSEIRAEEISKKITRELSDSEKKYRLIFESFQDVYYKTDLNNKVLAVSPSIKKLLDITPEEMVSRNMLDFYAKIDERELFISKIKDKGEVNDFGVTFKRPDGKFVDVSITTHTVLNESGQSVGTEGIIRDISERKKRDDELNARTEELERLNKLMTGRELKMIDLKKRLSKYEKVEEDL